MANCRPAATPLVPNTHLAGATVEESDRFKALGVNYRSAVGALSYLSTATRPDICFLVGHLSQFLKNPGILQWEVFTHILHYLLGTADYALVYSCLSRLSLRGYTDADWGNCLLTRRSVTCFLTLQNSHLIGWHTKKQPAVSLLSCKAEYRALADYSAEVLWLRQLPHEIGISNDPSPVVVHEDNQGCIAVANSKANSNSRQLKHVKIQLHFIQEVIKNAQIKLQYTATKHQTILLFNLAKNQKRKRQQLIQRGQRIVEDMLEDNVISDLLFDSNNEEEPKECPHRNPNKEREHDLTDEYPYFLRKPNCTGKIGLSPEQKITAVLRQLAYAVPYDSTDKYCPLGETTARQNMEFFCDAMQEIYGPTYLRAPNEEDLTMILAETASRGFPGCLGSLDCMHWGWKNCPKALAGQFKGKEKTPTIVLEAVSTHSTWIWHSFFGTSGTLNDINVLQRSPLFKSNLDGTSWGVNFDLNGTSYPNGYYLVDGIYPDWGTLIKSKGLALRASRSSPSLPYNGTPAI
ncbi:hypothetical protein PCANC_11823 [Puccinia coronata f. sp. avenae]|uniref:DDE Tnp4 domain-containing protein n=1 Tax=Puccinia coronata f. sp. avenae TaxID=200324 RepID=A0A2N5T0H9_9BASI|nr:hypothetical protein PCANC_11823 [Puccinia coronata f. sp. avenae]